MLQGPDNEDYSLNDYDWAVSREAVYIQVDSRQRSASPDSVRGVCGSPRRSLSPPRNLAPAPADATPHQQLQSPTDSAPTPAPADATPHQHTPHQQLQSPTSSAPIPAPADATPHQQLQSPTYSAPTPGRANSSVNCCHRTRWVRTRPGRCPYCQRLVLVSSDGFD